ncbi:MAG: ABC transporter permease, partial [Bacillota bacterium]|nr:ABC transporter permease [Bacillota bacterium]
YANGVWSNDAFGDRGWLAIALVIFTLWRPNIAIFGSFLFGGLCILYLFIPTGTEMAVMELYKMLPYVVTIIVLILTGMRNKKENQPPESLGLPYFREDR